MTDKEFCTSIVSKISGNYEKYTIEEKRINLDVVALTLFKGSSKEFYVLALDDKAYAALIKFLLEQFANKKIVLL
jgi:hypothetical protein